MAQNTQAILACADSRSLEVLANTADKVHKVDSRHKPDYRATNILKGILL